MIMVIAIGAVLMILATVAASYAVSGLNKANLDQNYSGALSAAYAGVEEYQSRLANDTSYTQYGNPSANFSSGSTLILPTAANQVNPAFGVGASGTWATVAGSGGVARFRYEVDNSAYASSGVIRIRSTGAVGNSTRSVVANLKQQGFLDFLYFTDYEIQDPGISNDPASCVMYAWAGRSSSCSTIQFATTDTIKGPVHSNDTMRICGSTFNGTVTTSNSKANGSGNLYTIPSGCGDGVFKYGKPAYSPVVGMPPTNSQMKKQTRSDLTTAGVPNPGCLYTGPTSITYNTGGTMTVRSPWTKAVNVVGDPATSGTVNAACGTPGTSSNQLGSATGQTITVPTQVVVFVQNVPIVSSDPNYWGSSTPGGGYTCTGAAGGTTVGNGIGYPTTNETAPGGTSTPYGCQNGDVFVSGTLSATTSAGSQQTVAAENYVYLTGDLKYNDPSADLLGLVGNNAVWIWNPVNGNANLLSDSDRRIDAAIISVAHTFQVQNFNKGGVRGSLTVNGAIAQKFRGPVGTGGSSGTVTGYSKNYVYDARLKYTAPPKFLSPVTTTYGVTTWMDVAAAFAPDGSKNAGS
ncbi:MAG: hypothetical protein JWN09_1985 [Microbacteriaceae bacterium]|nr:hypothetical protein [Microbacteriaceae bacterium]